MNNFDKVICPKCSHQFRAIPENVQIENAQLREALKSCLTGITVISEQFEFAGIPCNTYQQAREQAKNALRGKANIK
jgi:hypothetical protein